MIQPLTERWHQLPDVWVKRRPLHPPPFERAVYSRGVRIRVLAKLRHQTVCAEFQSTGVCWKPVAR